MELPVWLALGLHPLTQLWSARRGADEDRGVQGKQPPTSFLRKAAGLSKPPEQDAQPKGLSSPVRQSETVLLEEEVLVVEAVDRHPPKVFNPMVLPPPLAALVPGAWENEEDGLVLRPWQ